MNEELVICEALEQTRNTLTAEDREIAARPTHAGEHTKPWDAYCAVQRLFKEEVDQLDELSRDKKDKNSFSVHTKALREWWSTLSKESRMRLRELRKSGMKPELINESKVCKYFVSLSALLLLTYIVVGTGKKTSRKRRLVLSSSSNTVWVFMWWLWLGMQPMMG
jgi:hypothetical protein